MIHVRKRRVPPGFNQLVRDRGLLWLGANPYQKGEKLPPYWRDGLAELRREYKAICAYLGLRVQPATGVGTADHFVAKSGLGRRHAYSWSNYRYACLRMNSRKGIRKVLDPFTVRDGVFELDFCTAAVIVKASGTLSRAEFAKADRTITILGLDEQPAIRERTDYWNAYLLGELTLDYLKRHAPFVALEAARQGLLLPKDHHVTVADIRTWLDS